jgi:cytochrome c oxidase subunit 4
MTTAEEHVSAADFRPTGHEHPSERQYIIVALILGVITAIEVAVYYLDLSKAVLIVVLLVCAAVKFTMVALWFMHLRFDSRIFRRLFATGIVLAFAVYTIVLLTFGVFISDQGHPGSRPPAEEGNP